MRPAACGLPSRPACVAACWQAAMLPARACGVATRRMIDFSEYANVLCRVLNQTIKDPHTYLAVFVMHREGHARMDIIENVAFRFIELISCDFARTSEDVTRQHIAYRYNSLKSRLAMMQARLQDVQKLVQAKNPSLLVQIQKQTGTSSLGASGRF